MNSLAWYELKINKGERDGMKMNILQHKLQEKIVHRNERLKFRADKSRKKVSIQINSH